MSGETIWLWTLFLFTQFAVGQSNDLPKIVGTPNFLEVEYKLGFGTQDHHSQQRLAELLQQVLQDFQSNTSLEFATFLKTDVIPLKPHLTAVFKDIYLDTPDLKLLSSANSYRLRYRWTKSSHYSWYQLFSFVNAFYPTRCEIQFKRKYQIDPITLLAKVDETRFEFHNDAQPFNVKYDAPPPPWPEEEYLTYAINGNYRNLYRLLPTKVAFDEIGTPFGEGDFQAVLQGVTQRIRFHVEVVNPWGYGPNPNQIFIVTLDKTWPAYFHGEPNFGHFYELELQIDRNVQRKIAEFSHPNSLLKKEYGEVMDVTQMYSKQAYQALLVDLESLKKYLEENFIKKINANVFPPDFKYSRMAKMINLKGKL